MPYVHCTFMYFQWIVQFTYGIVDIPEWNNIVHVLFLETLEFLFIEKSETL